MLGFPPLLGPPLLLLPLLLALALQPPVRLFFIRVAVVLLPLFLPAPLGASGGVLGLLSPVIFQFPFFQLTIFPANQPGTQGWARARLQGVQEQPRACLQHPCTPGSASALGEIEISSGAPEHVLG